MNERLKQIRLLQKHENGSKVSQTEFAESLGKSRPALAAYESGAVIPDDTFIHLLCIRYGVNENWLRTGEGEMFQSLSREEEITDFLADVLKDEDESFRKRFIHNLAVMDAEGWKMLERLIESFSK